MGEKRPREPLSQGRMPQRCCTILGSEPGLGAKFTCPLSASGKRVLPQDIPYSDSISEHRTLDWDTQGHSWGQQAKIQSPGPGVPRRRGLLQAFGQAGGVGKALY